MLIEQAILTPNPGLAVQQRQQRCTAALQVAARTNQLLPHAAHVGHLTGDRHSKPLLSSSQLLVQLHDATVQWERMVHKSQNKPNPNNRCLQVHGHLNNGLCTGDETTCLRHQHQIVVCFSKLTLVQADTEDSAYLSMYAANAALLMAPSFLLPGTSWPSLNTIKAGKPYTLYFSTMLLFLSCSTFTTFNAPWCSCSAQAINGATNRHGPHHDAQKSTNTGKSLCRQ
eukprot:GHRR01009858.1.p1 GENE.GHRR01009858.1~~GHRR01009858.1.p1  ORF type:complete len:227 (-),score=35.44 GHRR01009858.1:338-1018(-)